MSPLGKFTLALLGLRFFGATGLFWGLFLGHILIDRTRIIKSLEKQLNIVDDNIRLMLPYKYFRYYNRLDGNFWGKIWGALLGFILFGFHGFLVFFIIGHFLFDTPDSRHARHFRSRLDHFFNNYLTTLLGGIIGFSLHSQILVFSGIIIGFICDNYRYERSFLPHFTFLHRFWFKTNPFKRIINSLLASHNSMLQSMAGLAAKVAKADGKVTENEISRFKKLFALSNQENHKIAKIFNKAKTSVSGWEYYAKQIKHLTKDNLDLKESIIENLFKIAVADGIYNPQQMELLEKISHIIDLPQGNFDVIKQSFIPKTSNASGINNFYEILGVFCNASDKEIKARWKELTNIYHPDRIQAQGASAEEVRQSTIKMAEINNAYQNIMKSRKAA